MRVANVLSLAASVNRRIERASPGRIAPAWTTRRRHHRQDGDKAEEDGELGDHPAA